VNDHVYFFTAANHHYASVKLIIPEEQFYFYCSLSLGKFHQQIVDRENQWHIGFLELVKNETTV